MKSNHLISLCFFLLIMEAYSSSPENFPPEVWKKMTPVFGEGGRIQSTSLKFRGVDVNIEDYPYHASLQMHGSHLCSAVRISNNWLITAAHCITGPKHRMTIMLGSNDLTSGGWKLKVRQKITHPLYNSRKYDNDIGLLQIVNTPKADLGWLELPAQNLEVAENTSCTVTGWLLNPKNAAENKLQAVNVPVVLNCQAFYGTTAITDGMMCAGFTFGEQQSCQGDSGAPLVIPTSKGTQLVGLVSWGYSCAMPNYPAVYTRVAPFIDWIREITKEDKV